MKDFNIAIIGCGNVGGGTARILLEIKEDLAVRAGRKLNLVKIATLFPEASAARWNLPKELFAPGADPQECEREIQKILDDKNIDLVVETVGGDGDYMAKLHERVLRSGKNLVTANKALLAKTGKKIFDVAKECGKSIGIEAAVCGAIPIIRTLDDGFTGDEILSASGIMNGTSNFILSSMDERGITFDAALKEAQALGYAEADPSLDINGGDACNKIKILIQHIYGVDAAGQKIPQKGINEITPVDVSFAKFLKSKIKLICYVKREENGVYACVRPMMVPKENVLSRISGATNAVRLVNRYSKENVLVGPGAGPLETGSAIVSDIIFIARQNAGNELASTSEKYELKDFAKFKIPYCIILKTEDKPGVTGIVASAIGRENINISTIGPNIHEGGYAYFPVCVEPAAAERIYAALDSVHKEFPGAISGEPKLFPILVQ